MKFDGCVNAAVSVCSAVAADPCDAANDSGRAVTRIRCGVARSENDDVTYLPATGSSCCVLNSGSWYAVMTRIMIVRCLPSLFLLLWFKREAEVLKLVNYRGEAVDQLLVAGIAAPPIVHKNERGGNKGCQL